MDRQRYRVQTLHRVILAGLGALAKAREGGEDLFRELVKKGEELEAQGSNAGMAAQEDLSGSNLATEGREILAYVGVLENLVHEGRRFERMVEAMMPDTPLPRPPSVLQARRNAAAREELISEFGLLSRRTSPPWQAPGRRTRRRSRTVGSRRGGFSLCLAGCRPVPGFPVRRRRAPAPVVAGCSRALGASAPSGGSPSGSAANGYLGGRRPVDLLASEPDRVVEAADREAAELDY